MGLHGSTCGAYAQKVGAVLDRQREEVDQRIAELQGIRADLDTLAAEAAAAAGSSQLVADCPSCLLMDDVGGGQERCSTVSSVGKRLTEDILEVLECDIGTRPNAPTPDDLVRDLRTIRIESDRARSPFRTNRRPGGAPVRGRRMCVPRGNGLGSERDGGCRNSRRLRHARPTGDPRHSLAAARGRTVSRLPPSRRIHLLAVAACVPCCLPLLIPVLAAAGGGLSAWSIGSDWSAGLVIAVAAFAAAFVWRSRRRQKPVGSMPLPLVDEWNGP